MKRIFKQIAEENNITEKEVKREIQNAIRLAMKNEDPKVKENWKRLFPNGKEPSPETFISVLAIDVMQKTYS